MRVGDEAARTFTVAACDTAAAVGSGSLPVLGTPVLLAWCEAVTCAAVTGALEPGTTTVGTTVHLRHRRPSPVGTVITIEARLASSDGPQLEFDAQAHDGAGQLVATAQVSRVIVQVATFGG